ncbi:MAG: hypothetical protein P8X43_15455 [Maritimibacter sp.]
MGTALHPVIGHLKPGAGLRAAVLITVIAGLLLPIGAGLWQTGRAAFGVLPAIGAADLSLAPWATLLEIPGFATATRLSLTTGLTATFLSLLLAVGFSAAVHGKMSRGTGARMLTPFLAAPHAAIAIGLAFVLSPSGWIARALALPFGWDRPPDIASVHDPLGLALILGLMVKEVPFLLLVILSALTQLPVRSHMATGRSLGYGRGWVWVKIILPQVWPLIRLPVLVVLAYSASVVDMAVILGPSNPPTLAVLLTRLFSDPDLTRILPGSAGGLVQAHPARIGGRAGAAGTGRPRLPDPVAGRARGAPVGPDLAATRRARHRVRTAAATGCNRNHSAVFRRRSCHPVDPDLVARLALVMAAAAAGKLVAQGVERLHLGPRKRGLEHHHHRALLDHALPHPRHRLA